jgi:hypothetical protein
MAQIALAREEFQTGPITGTGRAGRPGSEDEFFPSFPAFLSKSNALLD